MLIEKIRDTKAEIMKEVQKNHQTFLREISLIKGSILMPSTDPNPPTLPRYSIVDSCETEESCEIPDQSSQIGSQLTSLQSIVEKVQAEQKKLKEKLDHALLSVNQSSISVLQTVKGMLNEAVYKIRDIESEIVKIKEEVNSAPVSRTNRVPPLQFGGVLRTPNLDQKLDPDDLSNLSYSELDINDSLVIHRPNTERARSQAGSPGTPPK